MSTPSTLCEYSEYPVRPTGLCHQPISLSGDSPARLSVRLSIHQSLTHSALSIDRSIAEGIVSLIRSSLTAHGSGRAFLPSVSVAFLYDITYAYELVCLSVHASMHRSACADKHERKLTRAQEHSVRQSGPDPVETYGRIMPRTRPSDSRNLNRHEATCRTCRTCRSGA